MLCPVCNVAMAIKSSNHVINTEGTEPKLFIRQNLACRNPKCSNYEKVVKTIENELPVLKE